MPQNGCYLFSLLQELNLANQLLVRLSRLQQQQALTNSTKMAQQPKIERRHLNALTASFLNQKFRSKKSNQQKFHPKALIFPFFPTFQGSKRELNWATGLRFQNSGALGTAPSDARNNNVASCFSHSRSNAEHSSTAAQQRMLVFCRGGMRASKMMKTSREQRLSFLFFNCFKRRFVFILQVSF